VVYNQRLHAKSIVLQGGGSSPGVGGYLVWNRGQPYDFVSSAESRPISKWICDEMYLLTYLLGSHSSLVQAHSGIQNEWHSDECDEIWRKTREGSDGSTFNCAIHSRPKAGSQKVNAYATQTIGQHAKFSNSLSLQ